MSEIPIIGGCPHSREHEIVIVRSDGLHLKVKAPKGVSIPLVKKALNDWARGEAPVSLTQVEAEFVADILYEMELATPPKEILPGGEEKTEGTLA